MEISKAKLNKLAERFENFKDFVDMTNDSIVDLKNNLEILRVSVDDMLEDLEHLAKQTREGPS